MEKEVKQVEEKKLNIVATGKEKTHEEIVWNNLLDYMDTKNLDSKTKISYLKNSILYLKYEEKKRTIVNKIFGVPAIVTLIGSVGAYSSDNKHLALTLALATGALAMIGTGVRLMRTNPYARVVSNCSEVNKQEQVLRKVAPHMDKLS